jgi:hypothetical protein
MSKGREKLLPERMRKPIRFTCGILKLKPGEKSAVQELIEERRTVIYDFESKPAI